MIFFESVLLLFNLMIILFSLILKRRVLAIILVGIAIVQHFLINWNSLLNGLLWIINLGYNK